MASAPVLEVEQPDLEWLRCRVQHLEIALRSIRRTALAPNAEDDVLAVIERHVVEALGPIPSTPAPPRPRGDPGRVVMDLLRSADGDVVTTHELVLRAYGADTEANRNSLACAVKVLRRRGGEATRIQTCRCAVAGTGREGYRLLPQGQEDAPRTVWLEVGETERSAFAVVPMAPLCSHPDGPCGDYVRGTCGHCNDTADGIRCPLRHRPEERDMRTY